MTTRTQTKSIPTPPSPEKENIYSRPYYITPKMRREQSKKIEGKQQHINDNDNARTEAKATTTGTTKGEIAIKKGNSKKRNNPSSNGNNDNILVPEPQKLELNGLKLSDGIGKITPPKGWWDHAGIGGDLTGRGQPWQKGTKLGDLLIPSPIKQCVYGIGGVYEFTMMELPSTTVADFRKDADAYRKSQIGEAIDDDISDEKMDLLARKFWKRLGPTMTSSKYGADMEGTLFDGVEACGWNIDKLESCLQLLLADLNHRDIQDMKKDKFTEEDLRMPGVTSAYLYFGMWASVFCAHTEDMNLCSINYLHAGAPKYWYAISPQDSGRFESLMASMFSHQSAQCKEFLRHKRSLISPSILTKAGIEYTTQVQRAGDIMITYPGSYHFGFNTGFNVAESTNFAGKRNIICSLVVSLSCYMALMLIFHIVYNNIVPEWVPLGEEARVCMCHPHSVRIEMNRFKSLLYQYEKDQIINIQKNRTKMSYLEWARENVRSRICKRPRGSDKEDDIESIIQPSQSSSRYSKKGTVVEVMKLIKKAKNIQTNGGGGKQAKKRKKVTSKTKKNQKDDDYRLALRVKKSSFNDRRQTPVLCVLECDSNYHYFAGTVNAVVEDHARIHFAGTSKEDDIWMDVGSDMLFLDGGSCEKP
jgi:jumonji domain-containing protein 2